MMEKAVARGSLGAYFREGWWKYALLLGAAVFVWNLLFAMTAPVIPEDEKLDVYFCAGYVDIYSLERMAEELKPAFPELQDISLEGIPVDVEQDTGYAYQMQLVLRFSESQGDVFIMSKERFEAEVAPGNGFRPLNDIPGFESLPVYEREGVYAAVDISGWDLMPALEFDATDCVAFLPHYCSNPTESGVFLHRLANI